VKIAQTLDGFIAGEYHQRMQISCSEASQWVHRLRSRVDAIAIGGGTAVSDNPQLNVRGVPGHSPQRIVVCRGTQLPAELRMFQDGGAPCLVYSRDPQKALPAKVQEWPSSLFEEAWLQLLKQLGEQGFHRVLLEAGATMAGLVLQSPQLWNRFLLLTSPILLGKGLPWNSTLGKDWIDSLHLSRFELIGSDYLAEFENVHRNHSSSRSNP
jgi:diaminohydroxyphosphoribosylaminopyrimidine deaminase/5-amino-6-(5-phosphoribosylamino)uracil reductase